MSCCASRLGRYDSVLLGFLCQFLANSPDLLANLQALVPAARPAESRPEITFRLYALTSGGECIYTVKSFMIAKVKRPTV